MYGELGDFSEADALKQLEWRRESVAGMKAEIDPAKLSDEARVLRRCPGTPMLGRRRRHLSGSATGRASTCYGNKCSFT